MPLTIPTNTDPVVIPKEIRIFLERLLLDADISPKNNELKETMLQELAQRLVHQLSLDLLSSLPEDKFDAFEKFLDENPNQTEIVNFLKINIPQSDEIIGRTLLEFKDVFLGAKPVEA